MRPQAFPRVREERKETVEISEKRCQESKPLSEGTGILEGRRKEIHLGSVWLLQLKFLLWLQTGLSLGTLELLRNLPWQGLSQKHD